MALSNSRAEISTSLPLEVTSYGFVIDAEYSQSKDFRLVLVSPAGCGVTGFNLARGSGDSKAIYRVICTGQTRRGPYNQLSSRRQH